MFLFLIMINGSREEYNYRLRAEISLGSLETKPRASELVGDDVVHAAGHLRRHVVRPVAGDALPEERLAREPEAVHEPRPVHLQVPQAPEAAELDDAADDAGLLLRLGERHADEPRQPPHVLGGVAQQLLVPQEEHLLRTRRARAPVAQDVLPERAVRVVAVADRVEGVAERELRVRAPAELPQRDGRVLGLPADVHDPAADADAGARQHRVRHVRVHESRGRERVEDGRPSAVSAEEGVQERDALVRVEAEERVVGAGGWVGAARHRGERQGVQPRGAALGQAGYDDVVGTGNEAALQGYGRRDEALRQPEAVVAAELELGAGRQLDRQRGYQHVVAVLFRGALRRHGVDLQVEVVLDVLERDGASRCWSGGSVCRHGLDWHQGGRAQVLCRVDV
uniref:Uncharacterized protein n=1 Tax=Avena sativa TaxID=4498 RepID=A0ACD6AKQ7_AVESA